MGQAELSRLLWSSTEDQNKLERASVVKERFGQTHYRSKVWGNLEIS